MTIKAGRPDRWPKTVPGRSLNRAACFIQLTPRANPKIEAGTLVRMRRLGRTAINKRTKDIFFKAGSVDPAY